MRDSLRKARELLLEVTPLKTDCGKVCGSRCCRSLEGEETGMLLFPGEEEVYREKPEWKLKRTASGMLLVCSGRCAREERPLACRIFPLLPVIRGGEVKAAGDQRARAVCPLLKQGIRGVDSGFIDAVKEAGRILAEDPEQRRFMERLTEEQDELKTLREKLGGF